MKFNVKGVVMNRLNSKEIVKVINVKQMENREKDEKEDL